MAYQYQNYGGQPHDYNNQRQYGQGFQAQPNYSSAPVMRAGSGGGDDGGRRYDNRGPRAGLGADQGGRNIERDRQQVRENMMAQQPPTREEVARTIFIGGLGDNAPADEAIEAILRCAGKLRRWTRAKDADDVKCRFGFAEYEDVDSLEAAKELFGEGIDAPAYKDGKIVMQEGEAAGPQMLRLLVVIDEQSSNYIDEWMSKRNEGEDAKQFRIDNANEDLRQCMASLLNGDAFMANGFGMGAETVYNGVAPENGVNGEGLDDELADIPVEMRAIVAQEIKNFREQSTRRDQARIALEQESIKPMSRLESPGLQSNTNGSRLGIAGAPSGPKGQRGQDNGIADLPPEDESDASDAELERRRKTRKEEDLEKRFEDAERRWYAREKARANAADRDRVRQEAETKDRNRDRENISRKLEEFDDDEEDKTGHEEYYYDRSNWARKRQARRQREAQEDDLDRKMEERDKEAEQRRVAASRGAADRFLAETGAEIAARQQEEPAAAGFKISLGGAAARRSTAAPRRTIADMAGLLEEEEDAVAAGKPQREMRAIANASAFAAQANANMTDEEKAAARQALAADIPMEADRLFDRKVYWQHIGTELLEKEVRPFVERKVIEALGLQEDFLVELIMAGLKEHTTPQKLITDLEAVLDDEAEGLVRKVWRLVVYWGEAKEGGLMLGKKMSQLKPRGPRAAPNRPKYWIDEYPNYWPTSSGDHGAPGGRVGVSSAGEGERGVRESLAFMTTASEVQARSSPSSTSLLPAYRSEQHNTTSTMANGWALVISVIIVGAFSGAAWFLAPNGETKTIWRSSLVLAAWSMWLMWAITFLAQWHPLIVPERSDLRPEYVNKASGSAKLI